MAVVSAVEQGAMFAVVPVRKSACLVLVILCEHRLVQAQVRYLRGRLREHLLGTLLRPLDLRIPQAPLRSLDDLRIQRIKAESYGMGSASLRGIGSCLYLIVVYQCYPLPSRLATRNSVVDDQVTHRTSPQVEGLV